MILKPLSKSTFTVFKVCAFKAHAHKNLGFERQSNFLAANGKLIHKLSERVENGEISLEDAMILAGDPETAQLVRNAVLNDPYHGPEFEKLTETHVKINYEGEWVESDEEAVAYGYLDKVVFLPDELVIMELKSGRSENDDVFERHLYAGLLAKAAQPDYERIRFIRHFCRSGNQTEYLYEWKKTKKGSTKLYVSGPDGKRSQIRGAHANPMVVYLRKILKKIERTVPKPRPGSHCKNWFGSPCNLRGNVCPLTERLPAIVTVPGDDRHPEPLLKYAFLHLLKNSETDRILETSPDLVSKAYEAVLQLDAGIREVEKKVKLWADVNGPISIHGESYGWSVRQDFQIDKEKAMEILLSNDLALSDIVRAINISRSSVERMPKSMIDIKKQILAQSGSRMKKTFGLLGEKNA